MLVRRLFVVWVLLSFVVTSIIAPNRSFAAETVLGLPAPGVMVSTSLKFEPALIKGVTVHQDNPFLFDFIVDPGQNKNVSEVDLKASADRMIKYFFAALTVPDKDIWVNLSPYEKGRIVPDSLGETLMGRDFLAQDYLLKQVTASMLHPQQELGKDFWDKVYREAKEKFGSTQIPLNTFNKVWIMPDKAGVYEHGQTAYVVDGHLKVMLEADYLALTKHNGISRALNQDNSMTTKGNELSSQVVREIVIPAIEKEVNEGKNFATLRQVFYAQVLAVWFKRHLKQALLNQVYADKNTVKGIDDNQAQVNEAIYNQYLQAYKRGVFNLIKEDRDSVTQQIVSHQYFSGGYAGGEVAKAIESRQLSASAAAAIRDRAMQVTVFAATASDDAMVSEAWQWINNYQHILAGHVAGVSILGLAVVTGHALFQLGKRAKTIEAKRKIYWLLDKSNIAHIIGAQLFTLTGITLGNKLGINVDQIWFAQLLFISGTKIGGGIAGHTAWTKEGYQAAVNAKDVNDPTLKAWEQGNAWLKFFLASDFPIFAYLCYLGIFKPAPQFWPIEQLHHFLENTNLVFKQAAIFGTLGAGVGAGIALSRLGKTKKPNTDAAMVSFPEAPMQDSKWKDGLRKLAAGAVVLVGAAFFLTVGNWGSQAYLIDRYMPGGERYRQHRLLTDAGITNNVQYTTVFPGENINTIAAIAKETGYPSPAELARINGVGINDPLTKNVVVPGRMKATAYMTQEGYTPTTLSKLMFGDNRYADKYLVTRVVSRSAWSGDNHVYVKLGPNDAFQKNDFIQVWIDAADYDALKRWRSDWGTLNLILPAVKSAVQSPAALNEQPKDQDVLGGIDLSQQDDVLAVSKDTLGGVKIDINDALTTTVKQSGITEVKPIIVEIKPVNMSLLF